MNLHWLLVGCVLTVVGIVPRSALAAERIRDFDAAISIAADGEVTVTETIVVHAEQKNIKVGIYRDFPTLYKSKFGVAIRLPFDVKSASRDGKPESFHTEDQSNGVRVYIGHPNIMLKPGTYRYEISYVTNYQLGYFENHDELYWNVTGNGWEFPIEKATATVRVPEAIPRSEMKAEGYTGPVGSRRRNLTAQIDQQTGAAVYATKRALPPGHGLTIVLTMPKNFIAEPTAAERRELYMRANHAIAAVLVGMFAVAVYYLFAWILVGRDPAKGTIIPRFEPPQDMSPAIVRYLREMDYDKKCFTAAVINLAVNNVLTIDDEDGEFTLNKVTGGRGKHYERSKRISAGEKMLAKQLIAGNSIELKQANHAKIRHAIERLGKMLEDEYHGKLFFRNRRWLIPGWILSAVTMAVAAITSGWDSVPIIVFLCLWLTIWTIGVAFLSAMVFSAWNSALALRKSTSKRIGSFAAALFLSLFATPFIVAEFVVFAILVSHTSILMVPLVLFLIVINWLFWHLIKRPTHEGQRIRAEIEGFRMYLRTAEQEFLRQAHPPNKTVELYEEFLPYALALDVENEWAENFKDVLAAASQARGRGRSRRERYHPDWYQGNSWNNFETGAFATGIGAALGTAIASSATAPGTTSGSSSGGFSGGSSGGGGGGGGGGGW